MRIFSPWCAIIISVLAVAIGSSFAQSPAASAPMSIICVPHDVEGSGARAPETARVKMETTRGVIRIELHRSWAPHGVDRFYNLVSRGYYDDSPIFRVLAGRFAQFGISGKPKISQAWRTRTIPDDPRIESNVRGTVFFAFKDANGRTTQVVINLRDNSEAYDKEPFAPIGKVIEGMNVADAFYSEYGESALGGIRGGKQDPLFKEGNDYLKRNFPRLGYIVKATIDH